MASETKCNCLGVLNFLTLVVTRGSTPLMMLFAMKYLSTPSLVVALKCEISLVLFTLSAVCFLRNPDTKRTVLKNFQNRSTYWKLFVLGFLQSAAPYYLIAYSVQHVPITLVCAFTAVTPWWTHVIEFLLKAPNSTGAQGASRVTQRLGILAGIIGLILMVIPIVSESLDCRPRHTAMKNITNISIPAHTRMSNISNSSLARDGIRSLVRDNSIILHTTGNNNHPVVQDTYCPSPIDVLIGIGCMILASLSWSIASVFWARQKGDINYVVSNIGRNAFGGIICTVSFIIFGIFYEFGTINWGELQWMIYVGYLGAGAGWLGTLLVQSLHGNFGSRVTNQALTVMPLVAFIEDCVFVRKTFTLDPNVSIIFIAELFGLFFLTLGMFTSNFRATENNTNSRYERVRESFSERLLPLTEYPGSPGGGLNEGSISQIMLSQQDQYEQRGDSGDNEDHGDNLLQDDVVEQEALVPLDTEECVNYLREAPVL